MVSITALLGFPLLTYTLSKVAVSMLLNRFRGLTCFSHVGPLHLWILILEKKTGTEYGKLNH